MWFLTTTNPLSGALVSYDFSGNANGTYAAHVGGSAFSALSGGSLVGTGGNPGGYFLGHGNWGSGNYFAFTVTANSGHHLDLSSLIFDARGAGNGGPPSGFQLRSSLDGFTANIASGSLSGSWGSSGSLNLSGSAFQNLSTITFRIYGVDNNNNGDIQIDNVILDGVAAPEPATVALGVFGTGFALLSFGRHVVKKRRP
jgi:hypothetical protein